MSGERSTPTCKVAAVLLAAGSSTRFGADNKLLALLDGKPLIRHVGDALTRSRLQQIVVVTGPDPEAVGAALAGIEALIVHNARHLDGMGGSVAAGILAVSPELDGALVVPGDMPAVSPMLIARLVAAFAAHGSDVIVYPATADGEQRNPVLWPRRLFGALARLSGPAGAKSILEAHRAAAIAIDAEADSFEDIDTVADLARHRQRRADRA